MYGPAVRCKGFFGRPSASVSHQCIRPLVGALLRAIMDISARTISLADRPQPSHSGHQCSHTAGRPPSSSQILSQTSAGEKVATSSIALLLFERALLLFESSFVRAGRRSFVPACARTTAPRAGAVKAGRHSACPTCTGAARPRLDRLEHRAPTLKRSGASHRSSRI